MILSRALRRGAAVLAALALSACMPLTEAAGRLLDGSARAEKTLSSSRLGSNPAAQLAVMRHGGEVRVTADFLPQLRLYGTPPDGAGRVRFSRAVFLCGSYGGWNEVSYTVTGAAFCGGGKDDAVLRFDAPLQIVALSGGSIRKGTTRLAGERSLSELRHRDERINALVAWMEGAHPFKEEEKEALGGEAYFKSAGAFAGFWRPRLLPEIERSGKKLAAWGEGAQKGRHVFKEDVYWNTAYTEYIFPLHMHAYRNSGALLRDWEEAAQWIYLKYIWKPLPDIIVKG